MGYLCDVVKSRGNTLPSSVFVSTSSRSYSTRTFRQSPSPVVGSNSRVKASSVNTSSYARSTTPPNRSFLDKGIQKNGQHVTRIVVASGRSVCVDLHYLRSTSATERATVERGTAGEHESPHRKSRWTGLKPAGSTPDQEKIVSCIKTTFSCSVCNNTLRSPFLPPRVQLIFYLSLP